jgi:hypothetical protein
MEDFEKLGAFYLGKVWDESTGKRGTDLVLYDSSDLVTHAVCVGMTGSGKTGLCLDLIEEALIDGVPAVLIDPKGDLGNLLLTFPELRPEDFEPWIDEDEARKAGLSPTEFAAKEAARWREGLGEWGQTADRIRRLRDKVDFAIYTPGSTAGLPVSILKSFAAPPQLIRDDAELLRERVMTTATSVLGLLGIEADPLKSREHVLLSKILETLWREGRDADLAALVHHVQEPPFDRIGALALDSAYPAGDRFELASSLNNLLAAPGFSAWLEGHPLDVSAFLRTAEGKPRAAVFSIAHLNDHERMFVVSLLLNEVVAWMRGQSGTTSLRALLYIDEVFGLLPPVANPPSKEPLLLLLKQARAFGLGVVLATQNPVDLDYKGLSNTGTWLIGRLQTERDKARLMDGLEGVAAAARAAYNRSEMERRLASLGKRVFVMNNVHDEAPVVFESRWALSYLRGPLTRAQIKRLMDPVKGGAKAPEAAAVTEPAAAAGRPEPSPSPSSEVKPSATRPLVPPGVPEHFIPPRGVAPAGATLTYQPMVLGLATIQFADPRRGVNVTREVAVLTPIASGAVPVDWAAGTPTSLTAGELEASGQDSASFSELPAPASQPKSYATWTKSFATWIYGSQRVVLLQHTDSKMISNPDENERDFRARLAQREREARDAEVENLRQKYAGKIVTLRDRQRRAEQQLDKQRADVSQSGIQAAISVGATVLGGLFGRKRMSVSTVGRATTAARGAGRVLREREDVSRAEDNVEAISKQIANLEAQLAADIAALDAQSAATAPLQTIDVRPKKADISVTLVTLAWAPHWTAGGTARPAWE